MSFSTDLVQSQCPYCGESIELVIDPSLADQQYIEDCSVCCNPMLVKATTNNAGEIEITLRREDE